MADNGTPGNNQAQNAQVKAVVRILGLSREQREQLHREISGRNYGFQQILGSRQGHVRELTHEMNTNVIQKPEDIFLPIMGKFAWGVRRGHGTFLTMEFGAPHLIVREPITASPGTSPGIKRNLAKRRVTVVGHWHFWIQFARWELRTANQSVTNEDEDVALVDEALGELDGQILRSAAPGEAPNSCILNFDLGGSVYMSPSMEVDTDQWSIHEANCRIVSYDNNGQIIIDAACIETVIT